MSWAYFFLKRGLLCHMCNNLYIFNNVLLTQNGNIEVPVVPVTLRGVFCACVKRQRWMYAAGGGGGGGSCWCWCERALVVLRSNTDGLTPSSRWTSFTLARILVVSSRVWTQSNETGETRDQRFGLVTLSRPVSSCPGHTGGSPLG